MNAENYKKTKYNTPFITQHADPYIMKAPDGTFYFTASVPAYDRIVLRHADTVRGLKDAEEVTIWHKHESGVMGDNVWAPELRYLHGRWYVYYAAGEAENKWAIRPYVIRCESDDPMQGPWTELGIPESADEFSFRSFSLDMAVFEAKGRMFAIWAEKVSVGRQISNLYIAEMESPTKMKTAQVLLSTPDYDWERVDYWVNEGPAVLQKDGKVYVAFSASSTGVAYCLGLLTADEDADLLDPASWQKSRYPILESDWDKGLLGPGHNTFFEDENGQVMTSFHARNYDEIEGDPLYDPNRHCYLMKVEMKDGKPLLDYENVIWED